MPRARPGDAAADDVMGAGAEAQPEAAAATKAIAAGRKLDFIASK